jgi:transcriptional regulator with XRE-family HTH domain
MSRRKHAAEPPPTQLPPSDPPLDRVVAQVRFDPIPRLSEPGFIASVRAAIESEYPVVSSEHQRTIVLAPEGVAAQGQIIWHFSDAGELRSGFKWRFTLTSDRIALETSAYRSRWDFLARFERVLLALHELLDPATIERMNLRTIDRLVSTELPLASRGSAPVLDHAGSTVPVVESVQLAQVVYVVEVQSNPYRRGFGPGPARAPARPPSEPIVPTTHEAIVELRQLSGLSWAELARLFGVSRRALHFWVEGKPLSLDNEARLRELLRFVRTHRCNHVSDTRRALLTPVAGLTAFDLLLDRRNVEAGRLLDDARPPDPGRC